MFNFGKRYSLIDSGVFKGLTDYHSHILPGVDDGVQNIEKSIKILEYYESLGVKKVFFTPHVMEDFKENKKDYLEQRFKKFKAEYQGNMPIELAAEYMLDSKFEDILEGEEMLTIFPKTILVETFIHSRPLDLDNIYANIFSNDYEVILAHVERFSYLREEDYKNMKDRNVKFQLNILSLVGGYGEYAKKNAEYMLKNKMYDFLGTDIHSLAYHKKFFERKVLKQKVIEQLLELMNKNA